MPSIPLIRIALIGLGQRGMKTLERHQYITGAKIKYIADLDTDKLDNTNKTLVKNGRHAAISLNGNDERKKACQKSDVDLIYICTEWTSHTPIAVEAMLCGKHIAVVYP